MVRTNSPHPMPSQQNEQTQEMESHVSSQDSSSDFSVVSHPPESEIIVNGSLSGMNELHFAPSVQYAVDLSFEEMQMSIQRLLQENTELKDVVQKDHQTMKQQYELMLKSKDQIEEVMKQQSERREQAKTVIQKLQIENEHLKMQLAKHGNGPESSEGHIQQLINELERVKVDLTTKSEDHEKQAICNQQLQLELSELRSDFNQLKTANSRLLVEKKELAAINAELQAKCSAESQEELCGVSDSLADGAGDQGFFVVQQKASTNNESVRVPKSEETTIKNLLQQLHLEQLKSQELETKLKEERDKCGALARNVEGQEDVIRRLAACSQEKSLSQQSKLINELQATKQMLDIANSELHQAQDRCQALENQVSIYHNQIANLQGEIEGTKTKFVAELQQHTVAIAELQKANELDRQLLRDTEAQYKMLMEKHKQQETKWETASQDHEEMGRQTETYYKLQMKALQEKLDSFTANFVEIKDSLTAKEQQLAEANEEVEKLKMEMEIIPILRAQLEVYQADFRAERDARESAVSEKENLLSEVQRLQAMEQQMRRHGSRGHRGSHGRHMQPLATPTSEMGISTTASSPAEERSQFKCPKCNFSFRDYQALLNHVEQCLDNDDPIP